MRYFIAKPEPHRGYQIFDSTKLSEFEQAHNRIEVQWEGDDLDEAMAECQKLNATKRAKRVGEHKYG